jgi:hypothetical protein
MGRSGGRAVGTWEAATALAARSCDGLADMVTLGFRSNQERNKTADANLDAAV